MKQKLYDLINRRAGLLQQAEAALEADNRTEYQSLMEQITNLNGEIQQVQALVAEQERQMLAAPAPTGSEAMDMIQERTAALQRGDHVTFTANEVRRALSNQTTLATGTIVQPTGSGAEIRDPVGNVVPSIVDRVRVVDMTGMGSFMFMGLIGIIIASIVNLFLASSMLSFVISCVGVIVFTGLTAYDTQKLREFGMAAPLGDSTAVRRGALLGALTLYLDFINLFLMLLRLFGGNRD